MSQEKYELIKSKCTLDEIELKPALRASVKEILEDRDFEHALTDEGLRPRKLILLYGPPGCGKTSIAHAIAAETKLPLYLVSGAQMTSMYVGQSEKNAEEMFRFAEKEECVLLVDEFESFAGDRRGGSRYENSVVNTLLVNMENRLPKGLVVCATNFHDAIDSAILRRFDLILEVPQLSRASLLKVANNTIKGRYGICAEECVEEGKTPSGTVRSATNKLRSAIIASERKNPRPKPKKVKTRSKQDSAWGESGGLTSEELTSRLQSEMNRIYIPSYVPGQAPWQRDSK